MKKIYLTLALVFAMSINMFAQRSDGFFQDYYNDPYNRVIDDPNDWLNLPVGTLGSNYNEPAPLGTGLLILTALGVGYYTRKRKE